MIRPIKKTDIPMIKTIVRSVENLRENEIECCLDMVKEALHPSYAPTTVMCYEENKDVLGFVSYSEDEMTKGTWEIYWVAVHKDHQGKGIGKKLMLYAEQDARKANARQLVLETSSLENYDHVRLFYNKLGYTN